MSMKRSRPREASDRRGRRPPSYVLALAFLPLSSCLGTAPVASAPAGTPDELVQSWTATGPDSPGLGLFLRNNTSREVEVRSVTLESCQNIREECRSYELEVRLEPGEIRRVMSVHRLAVDGSYDVQWSFEWDYAGTRAGRKAPQRAP